MPRCAMCDVDVKQTRRCGRCKTRAYCSQICQRADWQTGHRENCGAAAKSDGKSPTPSVSSSSTASPPSSRSVPPPSPSSSSPPSSSATAPLSTTPSALPPGSKSSPPSDRISAAPSPSSAAPPVTRLQVVDFPTDSELAQIDASKPLAPSPENKLESGCEATTHEFSDTDLTVGAVYLRRTQMLAVLISGRATARRVIRSMRFTAVADRQPPMVVHTYEPDVTSSTSKVGASYVMQFDAAFARATKKLGRRFSVFVQLLDAQSRVLAVTERYMAEGDDDRIEFHGAHPRGILVNVVDFAPACLAPSFRRAGLAIE